MARLALCAVVLLVALARSVEAQVLSNAIATPVTVPFDTTLRPAADFANLTDPAWTPVGYDQGNNVSQVHLSLASPNGVAVHWATGAYKTGTGALTRNDPNSVPSVVRYGTAAGNLTNYVSGTAEVYDQIYNTSVPATGGSTALNYTSPILHSAFITGLKPNTTYFYQVGDNTTFSQIYNFTVVNPAGQTYPQRILAIADWGMSSNATSTLQHILQSSVGNVNPPVIFYIADYVYADTWYTNGTVSKPNTGFEGLTSGTWQPVWDAFLRFVEPLVSRVPWVGNTGNHEIEMQSDGQNTIFKAVQARWKYPSAASSGTFFYYSVNVGPVHGIFISPYVDYTPGSDQWQWLAEDLRSVNRSSTPWVIVNIHNPWVTTDTSYKEFEQMRASMEPLTYRWGVDIFYYGHVHAYERTYPVYDYVIDPCGAVHITIGDAGNSEGLSGLASDKIQHKYEDLNNGCPVIANSSVRAGYLVPVDPTINDPWAYYKHALTYNADGNSSSPGGTPGFCDKQQPAWSAYRESSFGHGTLDVVNATYARWQWHRNQDSNAVATDDVWIVRDTANCPNKLGKWPIVTSGLTTGPAPTPAPTTAPAAAVPAPTTLVPAANATSAAPVANATAPAPAPAANATSAPAPAASATSPAPAAVAPATSASPAPAPAGSAPAPAPSA